MDDDALIKKAREMQSEEMRELHEKMPPLYRLMERCQEPVPWLPRCPLCGQEYCGCWEDDS